MLEYVVPVTVATWLPFWKTRYSTPAVVLAVQAKLIWLDEIGVALSPVGGAGGTAANVVPVACVEATDDPSASTASTTK